MPSNFNLNKASFGLKFGAIVGILFLHIPLFLIILYAFTTEDKSYQFPPPGYTLKWFSIVLSREDIWSAVYLSLHVALVSTFAAIILGTLAAAALYKADFFWKTINYSINYFTNCSARNYYRNIPKKCLWSSRGAF